MGFMNSFTSKNVFFMLKEHGQIDNTEKDMKFDLDQSVVSLE